MRPAVEALQRQSEAMRKFQAQIVEAQKRLLEPLKELWNLVIGNPDAGVLNLKVKTSLFPVEASGNFPPGWGELHGV